MKMLKRKMLLFSLGVVAMMALALVLTMPATEETPVETANTDAPLIWRSDALSEFQIRPQTVPEGCTDWRLSDPPQCVYVDDGNAITLITPPAPTEDE